MKILVACEYSGRLRDAFRDRGHDAYSCDILPTEGRETYQQFHIQGDVLAVLNDGWDMVIGFPPCQYLTYGGIRYWNVEGRAELREAAHDFFMALYNAPVDKVALENPVGYMNTVFRKPDQIIQPYYFGDPHVKRTCLWLRGLPKLVWEPNPVKPEPLGEYKSGPQKGKKVYYSTLSGWDKNAAHHRSLTFQGIANAMAQQWG